MAEISPELVERMVALVRDLHGDHVKHGSYDIVQDFVTRTAAIVAELPGAEQLEARRIISESYGPTRNAEGRLQHGDGPARVDAIVSGKADDYWEMRCVIAAIKRGRELEQGK